MKWLNFKLSVYAMVARLMHRHDWRCTDEPVHGLTSSERPYWHIDRCADCGARREVMSNGYCVGGRR